MSLRCEKMAEKNKLYSNQAPYTVVADHDGWQERDYPQTR